MHFYFFLFAFFLTYVAYNLLQYVSSTATAIKIFLICTQKFHSYSYGRFSFLSLHLDSQNYFLDLSKLSKFTAFNQIKQIKTIQIPISNYSQIRNKKITFFSMEPNKRYFSVRWNIGFVGYCIVKTKVTHSFQKQYSSSSLCKMEYIFEILSP